MKISNIVITGCVIQGSLLSASIDKEAEEQRTMIIVEDARRITQTESKNKSHI